MRKVVRVIEIKLFSHGPGEEGFQISFIDYKPETEKVDPRMDRFRQLTAKMKEKVPDDVMELMQGLVGLGTNIEASMPTTYFPQGWFFVVRKEYLEMGSPMVGDLLSLEISKATEEGQQL